MGREEHCKQISLVCVGSARRVWATLGLLPLTACVLSWSTPLRLQVALQGISKAGLGLCALPRFKLLRFRFSSTPQNTDSVGPAFCALPRSEQLRRPDAWRVQSPQVSSASYHLPNPSPLVSWVRSGSNISAVPCVSCGELISDCKPPGGCQPSRIPGRLG